MEYIDKVKKDSPDAIEVLIQRMRTDTDMVASTAQGRVHDGGLSMIKWCQRILATAGFPLVGVALLPVTPPHTPPPVLAHPVTADGIMTAETERVGGEQGVSGLDQLYGAAEPCNSWRSSTPLSECDDLPSSSSAEVAVGPASEDGHVPVRRHSPEVRLFDAPEMPEYWPDESALPYFDVNLFATGV